jgi:hypothetical protein
MPLSMNWRTARYFIQKPDPGPFFEHTATAPIMRNGGAMGRLSKFYADDSVAEINSDHLKKFCRESPQRSTSLNALGLDQMCVRAAPIIQATNR